MRQKWRDGKVQTVRMKILWKITEGGDGSEGAGGGGMYHVVDQW